MTFSEARILSGSRVQSLDGLRGIAVVLVLLSHLDNAGIGFVPGLSFSGVGKYGVYLFFALSAFLLTSLLLRRTAADLRHPHLWRGYLLRRVLRIYPAYTVALVVHPLLVDLGFVGFGGPYSLGDVLAHLALVAGVDVFWTIPVECKFYAALPLVVLAEVLCFGRRRSVVVPAMLLCIVLAAGGLEPLYDYRANPIALGAFLATFLVGCLGASIQSWFEDKGFLRSPQLRLIVEVAGCTGFALVLALTPSIWSRIAGHPIPLDHFHSYPTTLACLWMLCIMGALNGRGVLAAALSFTPLRLLGTISFSRYLWHFLVLQLVIRYVAAPPWLEGLLVTSLSIGVATLSYLLIERPCLRLASHLDSPRWQAQPSVTDA